MEAEMKQGLMGLLIAIVACGRPEAEREGSLPEAMAEGVAIVAEGLTAPSVNQTFPAQDPVTGDFWFSVYEGSFDDQTIMVARRTPSGWASPENAPFSGEWGDRAPRFSPDGSELYITSNRPRPGASDGGDMNVWRVRRTESGWGEPELLQSGVNSEARDIHPSITSSAIWVASNREGGLGRSDLYRVGSDGGLEHLGPPLNDELSQPDLWVSPDESWMILAITDHPDGYGGDDLYISWLTEEKWAAPVNLGPDINTAEYEYGPWVTSDGEFLLFTSHRDGASRTYRVPLDIVREVMPAR
jgi:hypothetical protein